MLMKSIQNITTRQQIPFRRVAYRSFLYVLIACFMLIPAASASRAPTSIRIAMIVSKDMELYPLQLLERDAVSILDLVYESVIELDDDREPVPSLAEKIDALADGASYIITLRENVFFHDGTQMTAYDVVATMNAIRDIAQNDSIPQSQKGLYYTMPSIIASWQATDTFTLRIQAKSPNYAALNAMTFPVLQAQSLYTANPPGTGPYRVDYYAPGEQLWLSGNQDWWQQPPNVREIIAIWYDTIDVALAAFEAEQVDIVMTRSPTATRYRGTLSSRTNSYSFSTRQLECLLMMNARGLNDPEMRKAIAYAINKDRLMINVYQNVVTGTDTIQSRSSYLYSAPDQPYSYSPEKASAILDSLGWNEYDKDGRYRIKRNENGDEQTLKFNLNYYDEPGNGLRKDAANEIAIMLRSVGFRIVLSALSFEDAQSNLKNRNYDLFLCAYNLDVVLDPNYLLIDRAGGNYVNYKSEEMTSLTKELQKASDRDDYIYLWGEIQKQFHKELPFLPLYYRDGVILTRYTYSNVRDIREYELLKGIAQYR